jgi:hypothetical protein
MTPEYRERDEGKNECHILLVVRLVHKPSPQAGKRLLAVAGESKL